MGEQDERDRHIYLRFSKCGVNEKCSDVDFNISVMEIYQVTYFDDVNASSALHISL